MRPRCGKLRSSCACARRGKWQARWCCQVPLELQKRVEHGLRQQFQQDLMVPHVSSSRIHRALCEDVCTCCSGAQLFSRTQDFVQPLPVRGLGVFRKRPSSLTPRRAALNKVQPEGVGPGAPSVGSDGLPRFPGAKASKGPRRSQEAPEGFVGQLAGAFTWARGLSNRRRAVQAKPSICCCILLHSLIRLDHTLCGIESVLHQNH